MHTSKLLREIGIESNYIETADLRSAVIVADKYNSLIIANRLMACGFTITDAMDDGSFILEGDGLRLSIYDSEGATYFDITSVDANIDIIGEIYKSFVSNPNVFGFEFAKRLPHSSQVEQFDVEVIEKKITDTASNYVFRKPPSKSENSLIRKLMSDPTSLNDVFGTMSLEVLDVGLKFVSDRELPSLIDFFNAARIPILDYLEEVIVDFFGEIYVQIYSKNTLFSHRYFPDTYQLSFIVQAHMDNHLRGDLFFNRDNNYLLLALSMENKKSDFTKLIDPVHQLRSSNVHQVRSIISNDLDM